MQIDGVTAVAVIIIVSFAIDRLVTAFFFLATCIPPVRHTFPRPSTLSDPADRHRALRRNKFMYFVFAFVIGFYVAGIGGIRIFSALGFYSDSAQTVRIETTKDAPVNSAADAKTAAQGFPLPYDRNRMYLDCLVTAIIMAGGAERVAKLLKMAYFTDGETSEKEASPVEVTGRLIMENAQPREEMSV